MQEQGMNGSPPTDPLDAEVERLEGLLAPLEARRSDLEAELAEIAERERRLNGAITALSGPPPKKPAGAKPRASNNSNVWTPGAETIERVFNVLRAGGQMNITEAAEQAGTSRDTVQRSLTELRKQERVRLVGAQGRGGAHVFEVMP
jgi:hypothetical protein